MHTELIRFDEPIKSEELLYDFIERIQTHYMYDCLIIKFRFKYQHEEGYECGVCEVAPNYTTHNLVFFDDWNEGQECVEFLELLGVIY